MKLRNLFAVTVLTLFSSSIYAFEFSAFASASYLSGDDEHNNFTLGHLELVGQRNLSEQTYAIIDVIFEAHNSHSSTEIERLSINRTFSDTFEIGIGRYMQPLGFWNHNFAHGSLSQTTISRPFMIDIEHHDKGFLPSHLIGLLMKGETDSWTYQFGIGNTDSIDSSPAIGPSGPARIKPINTDAPNNDLTLIFRSTYAVTDNFELGLMLGSHKYSEISDAGLIEYGEVLFEEQFASLDFNYSYGDFHTFAEYYSMRFDDNQDLSGGSIIANDDTYNASAYYIQVGYRVMPDLTISTRYESLDYDDNATLFLVQGIVSQTQTLLALSYMLEESNILRFEAKQVEPDVGDSDTIIALQWYFFLL